MTTKKKMKTTTNKIIFELNQDDVDIIVTLVGKDCNFEIEDYFKLANMDPDLMRGSAKNIHKWLKSMAHGALIPKDYQIKTGIWGKYEE